MRGEPSHPSIHPSMSPSLCPSISSSTHTAGCFCYRYAAWRLTQQPPPRPSFPSPCPCIPHPRNPRR
ncbi:hypothetical protein COCCADRAFT_85378 [Bipolaris zeicola 26-R-13]|uniref:Uncharacterized protein n=1 Tax=Cochliobolus carbonum (strain 26-R-13) TaxID=930089 RepID=W6YDH1_COCC2|nr:uncharacterized protein COCCADRAFT_85378 [Bipolaris zeicola 26-R-13]EUC37567.1 hypothetical protein COCCADRAFT_85378 [Bipolaris zeicola 26-R-13]